MGENPKNFDNAKDDYSTYSRKYWEELRTSPDKIFNDEYRAVRKILESKRGELSNTELIGLRNIIKDVLAESLRDHDEGTNKQNLFAVTEEALARFNAEYADLK